MVLLLIAALDCSAKNPIVEQKTKYEKGPLAKFVYLNLQTEGSLSGVECFPNLETLDVENRKITDLTPVAKLVHLKKLKAAGNQIRDLSPLIGLGALEELDISNNGLVDLRPIAGLSRLKSLKAWDNAIADLTPLAGLFALTELRLYNNRVTDVAPLAKLKQLSSIDFERNAIGNLDVLRKAGIPVSEHSRQYKGSCAVLLKGTSAGFAICPPWEDKDAAAAFKTTIGEQCRVERVCNGVVGVDCHSAADGPYYYYDRASLKELAVCGGACMGGRCTNCPPKQMAGCPTY